MKVRGTLAALVAITAALTLTHLSTHPQVHAQSVDNSQAITGQTSQASQDDLLDLRALRASRSRTVTTPSPLKSVGAGSKFIRNYKSHVVRATPHVTRAPKPVVKRYSQPFVSDGSSVSWAHTRSAFRVANCESGDRSAPDVNTRYNGDAHLHDGKYHGKWQMDADFWSTYGGLKYASDAADASEAEQDAVAYKGYQARGWQPWSCSRIMGVR